MEDGEGVLREIKKEEKGCGGGGVDWYSATDMPGSGLMQHHSSVQVKEAEHDKGLVPALQVERYLGACTCKGVHVMDKSWAALVVE
jgi:hypothetical protein